MTICFLADFRSPIARSWISYFAGRHRVHVISTQQACSMPGVELHSLSRASSGARHRRKTQFARWLDPAGWVGQTVGRVREHVLLPAEAVRRAGRVRTWLKRIEPDLVHSLRIPSEAEIGGLAGARPHLISAWGNDFTLFAERGLAHRLLTQHALGGCAGFLADAQADVARARRHGLPASVPTLVVPGAGGVDRRVFSPQAPAAVPWSGELAALRDVPTGARLVVNARGFRTYVRNDTFFAAARELAEERKDVFFVGVGLRGWQPVEEMVERLGLKPRVVLTGALRQEELARLHRASAVMVSPTEHDGTPNTLLEAMACGALPVCGDLPSIREWIDDGVNGLVVAVDRPGPLTAALRRALADQSLARRAREQNPGLIEARAEYESCMARAAEFYDRVLFRQRSLVSPGVGVYRKAVRP